MSPRLALIVILALLGACADSRVTELERAVRELRAQQERTLDPRALDDAMAPLRRALDGMVEARAAERLDVLRLAGEVRQLATWNEAGGDEGRRTEVAALRTRLDELEARARQAAAATAEERELLLRALSATAEKLELFLQRVAPPAQPAAGRDGGGEPPREQQSSFDPAWALAALAALAFAGLCLVLLRRRGGRAHLDRLVALDTTADAVPFDQATLVELDPPPAPAPAPTPASGVAHATVRAGGPVPLVATFVRTSSDALAGVVGTRLRADPRVLALPAPVFVQDGPHARLELYVQPELPPSERSALLADLHYEVAQSGKSDSDRRTA